MPALDTSLAYYRAWTGGDFEAAMAYVADDIAIETPAGAMRGADAFRAFMGPFAGSVTGTELLAAYGDDDTALLMYDTATPVAASAPGAERHTVVDGKITALRIVFDRLPFDLARRS